MAAKDSSTLSPSYLKSRDYYYRKRDDPEFKRKRKEYSARRFAKNRVESMARARVWALANPARVREIARESRQRQLLRAIYRNCRKRAKARGLAFDIEISDVVVPEVCPFFGVPFNMKASADDYDFAPSIDRIDSSLGYVKGNIQVISRLANCMKWTATPEQLVTFANAILKRASECVP